GGGRGVVQGRGVPRPASLDAEVGREPVEVVSAVADVERVDAAAPAFHRQALDRTVVDGGDDVEQAGSGVKALAVPGDVPGGEDERLRFDGSNGARPAVVNHQGVSQRGAALQTEVGRQVVEVGAGVPHDEAVLAELGGAFDGEVAHVIVVDQPGVRGLNA